MDAPNVVLIVLDTARADYVSGLENSAFQDVAGSGRRFTHAVAPAPWTLPSHSSLFSGMRPSEHGITGAAVIQPGGPPRSPRHLVEALDDQWLPEAMRRRGYATFAATSNPWVGSDVGLTFGFERVLEAWERARLPKFSDPLGTRKDFRRRLPNKLRGASVHARRFAGLGDGGAAYSLAAFRDFLTGERREFFAFFNLMESHAPYAPPSGFNPLPLSERLAGIRVVRRWNVDRILSYCLGREDLPAEEQELLRGLYKGEIRYSDAWVGRLLEMLDSVHRLEDTVVVVTSDHGENLGEHHRLSHVMSMHETLLAVPLAIKGPGVPPGNETRPVSLMALRGVIEGLVAGEWIDPSGVPVVAEYESAAAQVSGRRTIEERAGDTSVEVRDRLSERWFAAYENGFKYTVSSSGHERLVEPATDPAESVDVSSSNRDVFTRLRNLQGNWNRSETDQPAPGDSASALDEEIASHLEGLGYL